MAKAKKRSAAKKASKRKAAAKVLPMKMSALIKVALADIRKAEKAEDMVIDMGTWFDQSEVICTLPTGYEVSRKKVCVACAAGSVMRYSLGGDIAKDLMPSKFPKNERQLNAIDDLRQGCVSCAANSLGFYEDMPDKDYHMYDMHIPSYNRDNPEPFHRAMEKLRQKLIKAHL